MKKIIQFILIGILIGMIIIVATNVYATNEEEENFASVMSNDVTPGSNANITLNLKNIEYKSYCVELVTSSDDVSMPSVTNGENGEKIENVTKNETTQENKTEQSIHNNINNNEAIQNNEISNNIANQISNTANTNSKKFTISNIENINSIILSIPIAESSKVGSKIIINITITDETNSKNTVSTQITLNVVEANDSKEINEQNNNDKKDSQQNQPTMIQTKTSGLAEQTNLNNSNVNAEVKQTSVTMNKSNVQTITYNGSDNNYLDSIGVNGENISDFNKTNTTYFKTVEAGTNNVDISYERDDSNSSVCIYGNSDLKTGLNKILITVTAQNGNTKIYRVYINVKS